jgi:hypothetical protein
LEGEGLRRGQQVQDGVANGKGDSGGPIFTLTGPAADIVAVGMIAAGEKEVACGGHPSSQCFRRAFYTRISAIRGMWHIHNVTTGGLK